MIRQKEKEKEKEEKKHVEKQGRLVNPLTGDKQSGIPLI